MAAGMVTFSVPGRVRNRPRPTSAPPTEGRSHHEVISGRGDEGSGGSASGDDQQGGELSESVVGDGGAGSTSDTEETVER